MAVFANPLAMTPPTSGLAIDAKSLAGLKVAAGKDPQQALGQAAREFEAVFLNQVLKSMRESLPKDGPFASSSNDTYTQMLDRELSKAMSAKGTGLAAVLEKQLARAMAPKVDPNDPKLTAAQKAAATAHSLGGPVAPHALGGKPAKHSLTGAAAARAYALPAKANAAPAAAKVPAAPAKANAAPATPAVPAKVSSTEAQKSFLAKVVDLAKAPAASVGLSPVFVAAQAALESGWGKHEIRRADGSSAHNLFSIKAGSAWNGATVDVTTTEYVNGSPVKRVEKFRAYESYAEGLADYVKLLATNSRYKDAVAKGQDARGFSQALAKAGYATDPAYSQKLTSVIAKARAATGEA